MTEEETFRQWLKDGLEGVKKTLEERAVKRILQGFFELIVAVVLFGLGTTLAFLIHWLLVFPLMVLTILTLLHGFYLLTHSI